MNRAERRWATREDKRETASFLPRPSGLDSGTRSCKRTRGKPETVSFACGACDELKVCTTCQDFAQRCEGCSGYHLIDEGQGGEDAMPQSVPETWLKEHGYAGENCGDVPILVVRAPPDYEPPMCYLATYWEIDGNRASLEPFSG